MAKLITWVGAVNPLKCAVFFNSLKKPKYHIDISTYLAFQMLELFEINYILTAETK